MALSSPYVKAFLILIPLGGILDLIGFASPYWIYMTSTDHGGLWQFCSRGTCANMVTPANAYGVLRAIQFFETVGFILVCCAVVLLFLIIFVEYFRGKTIFLIVNAVLCFVAAFCILVGAIFFGVQEGYMIYLSWAFAFCIVGAILIGMAGVFLTVTAVRN